MSGAHRHGTPACLEIFARLSDYLDGELDSRICREIEGHMEDCAPCVAFLESLRRTVAHLETQPASLMPEEVGREVCRAIERLRRDGISTRERPHRPPQGGRSWT